MKTLQKIARSDRTREFSSQSAADSKHSVHVQQHRKQGRNGDVGVTGFTLSPKCWGKIITVKICNATMHGQKLLKCHEKPFSVPKSPSPRTPPELSAFQAPRFGLWGLACPALHFQTF